MWTTVNKYVIFIFKRFEKILIHEFTMIVVVVNFINNNYY